MRFEVTCSSSLFSADLPSDDAFPNHPDPQGMMPLNLLSPLFVELVPACGLEGLFHESELRPLSQSAGLQGLIPDRDLSTEGGNGETRRRPRKWCSWSHDKGCQPRWFFPAKREGFEAALGPFPHGICKEDWRSCSS